MYVVSGIRVSALAVCALLAAAAASAATLTEGSLPGGAFSGAWNSPTEVGAGFDIISGTGNQNQFDNFYFSALPSGSQTLSFDFTAPEGFGYSYSAGGEIYTSTSPFRWGWDGVRAPQSVSVNYYNPQQSFTLDLGDDFAGGSLYLGDDTSPTAQTSPTTSALRPTRSPSRPPRIRRRSRCRPAWSCSAPPSRPSARSAHRRRRAAA